MKEVRYQKSLIYTIFQSFAEKDTSEKSSLGDIIYNLHDIGFAILMFLLSMPIAIPLPAWGIAIMSLGCFRRDINVIFLGMIVSLFGLWVSYEFIIIAINLIYMI